jgi:hypothetical protein
MEAERGRGRLEYGRGTTVRICDFSVGNLTHRSPSLAFEIKSKEGRTVDGRWAFGVEVV